MPIFVQEAGEPIVTSTIQMAQPVAQNTTAHLSHRHVIPAKTFASVNVCRNLPRCWDEVEMSKAFGKFGPSNDLFRSVGPAGQDGKDADKGYNQSDVDRAIEFILCPPADVMTLDHSTSGPPHISYQVQEFPDIPGLVPSPTDLRPVFKEEMDISSPFSPAIKTVGLRRHKGGWRSVCILGYFDLRAYGLPSHPVHYHNYLWTILGPSI
nr:uncharacterized protein LOC129261768 [Lytechinus pictus]